MNARAYLPNSRAQIARAVLLLVLVGLVAPFVVYAVPAVVGADASFVVLTASMTPAIAPGDVVVVEETDPAAIEQGDVITFVNEGEQTPTTHRVIGIEETGDGIAFQTQGDTNDNPDSGLVPQQNVIGAVVFTIPYIGYVIQFAGTTIGFVTLVAVPIGLLVLTEIWSLIRAGTASGTPPASETQANAAGPTPDGSEVEDGRELSATETESGEYAVTATDLTFSTVALGAFAAYSAYVAYVTTTALTVSVAAGTGMTFLVAAGIRLQVVLQRYRAGRAVDGEETSGATLPDEEVDSR